MSEDLLRPNNFTKKSSGSQPPKITLKETSWRDSEEARILASLVLLVAIIVFFGIIITANNVSLTQLQSLLLYLSGSLGGLVVLVTNFHDRSGLCFAFSLSYLIISIVNGFILVSDFSNNGLSEILYTGQVFCGFVIAVLSKSLLVGISLVLILIIYGWIVFTRKPGK